MNNDDKSLNMVHALEQAETAIMNFAKMVGSYHKQLLSDEFTPEQAFELTRDYQQESLRNMFDSNK